MTTRRLFAPRLSLVVALGVVLSLVLLGSPAHAGVASDETEATSAQETASETCQEGTTQAAHVEQAEAQMTLIDDEVSRSTVDDVDTALRSGEITLQVPQDLIASDQAKVYDIETAGASFTSVTYPMGGDYSMLSNLTVVLDEDGEIVQYAQALVSESSAGTFDLRSHVDGELVFEEQTDIPYVTDAEMRQDLDDGSEELRATAQAASDTALCLAAVLGVSVGFAGVLAFFCSGACATAVTPPTAAVCAACIAGFTTIGGASITAIASCFN